MIALLIEDIAVGFPGVCHGVSRLCDRLDEAIGLRLGNNWWIFRFFSHEPELAEIAPRQSRESHESRMIKLVLDPCLGG